MTTTTDQSPELLLLTRLYAAQRRLRWARSVRAGLRWFAAGSLLAALGLVILWNWNRLPGPWQWLATANRPIEFLWLPLLTALGGFATQWTALPDPRRTAYSLDKLLDSQERILTSIDWVMSEKPRTETSERLLAQSAGLLRDKVRFEREVRGLERLDKRSYALLVAFGLPLLLLGALPDQVGMTNITSVWLSETQVDQLTEDLLRELEQTSPLQNPQDSIEKLLQQLEQKSADPKSKEAEESARQALQRAVDQLSQQADTQRKARELLETLSQRARQAQSMSEKDKDALDALKKNLSENQKDRLEEASEAWEKERFEEAAEALESLQKEAGESALEAAERAHKASNEGALEGDQGQEFDHSQGDQFESDGTRKGEQGQAPGQSGQGQGRDGEGDGGQGEGQAGQGQPGGEPSGVGRGTTLEDEGPSEGASGRQSLRRSDRESSWLEEYQHLHAPERTSYEKAQTKVEGQRNDQGPKFRTGKEGLGDVTQPGERQGSGGVLEYRQEAENAILREEVPADYRDNVRIYFEALDRPR